MTSGADGPAPARGAIRLLNTADGGALCLAGDVDAVTVAEHLRRYGRQPAAVDRIDAGSVTTLSEPALELLADHLDAADRAGRQVRLTCSTPVRQALAGRTGR